MSEQEFRDLIAAMEAVHLEHASTPEKAIRFLTDEGFLDESGEVHERYRVSCGLVTGTAS